MAAVFQAGEFYIFWLFCASIITLRVLVGSVTLRTIVEMAAMKEIPALRRLALIINLLVHVPDIASRKIGFVTEMMTVSTSKTNRTVLQLPAKLTSSSALT